MNQLPHSIRLNGTDITAAFSQVTEFPVDFGRYRLAANEAIASGYPVRVFSIEHDGEDHRWVIYNTIEDPDSPPLWLSWTDVEGVTHGPHALGSGQGFHWVDDAVTEQITGDVTTPWDGWMETQIQSDYGVDIDYTASKGSGNCEFHQPEGVMMLKHGVSLAGYRWFNAYVAKQLLRNRHRWFGNAPFGVDGKTRKPIQGFSYLAQNSHGMNSYDPGHFDGSELFWGWSLTGDPMFLLEMLHLWCHARQHVDAFQGDWTKIYNGRQIGWPLVFADQMLRATDGMDVLGGLREQVIEFAGDMVRASVATFPIGDVSAIPSVWLVDGEEVEDATTDGAEKALYAHTWHYTPTILACDRLTTSLSHLGKSELAAEAQAHADELADWMNNELYAEGEEKPIATKWSKKHDWMGYTAPPGVADWPSGCLSVRKEPGPMGEFLIEFMENQYGHKTSPYHFSFALGKIPIQLGYEPLPPFGTDNA